MTLFAWPLPIHALAMDRLVVLVVISLAVLIVPTAYAQSQSPSEILPMVATPANLSPPIYPSLARQAHISGRVRIRLQLQKDGTVGLAEVGEGHPMLRQAALDSVQRSTFECGDCAQEKAWYSFDYIFEIRGQCHFGAHCSASSIDGPTIAQSPGQVRLSVGPSCTCDPTATLVKFRSARCLYLWKCGQEEVPNY